MLFVLPDHVEIVSAAQYPWSMDSCCEAFGGDSECDGIMTAWRK